jgi:type I restriction enzyme S subunit
LISCKVIRGTDFLLVQRGDFSEIPNRFVSQEKIEELKLKTGDILVEISGGSKDQPTGRILFWDKEAQFPITFSNFVKKLKLITEEVEPKYFFRYWQFLYLKGRTKDYEERTTNIRNFKLKDFLENEEIPLPPLPIQQKIVKILDTIQETVEIQEKIIEKTKEFKKSMMNLLFHYGLAGLRVKELMSSRVSEFKRKEFEKLGFKLKKTEIGEIPEDWEVVRLGGVGEIYSGGNAPQEAKYFENGQYPFIRVQHFDGEKPYIENWDLINEEAIKKYNLKLFPAETIIFPKSGASIQLEKRAKLKIPAYIVNHLCALIINQNKANIDFILNYLKNIKLFEFSGGSTLPYLNISKISKIPIPLPPLPEQQEIAEILQTIDKKIEIEKKKKELYEELFKTMLNKIMNQEIDVELLDY